jgi:competence protein ComEC
MGGDTSGWRLAALGLAWLGGVALQLQERVLLPGGVYAVAALAGLATIGVVWRARRGFVLALLGVAALGFAASGGRAVGRSADALPATLEGQDIVVVGTVASLPQRSASGLRFRFEVEHAELRSERVALPPLLALGWYTGFHEDAELTPPQVSLRAGQRWRFTVRLRQPHGNLNPHGFDYELQLFEQGIHATGYVRDAGLPLRLGDAAGHPVERARQRLRDAIEANVPDHRTAGVLAALSVGDQAAIEREDWDLFRNTGVAHLMSISGLHVTMFAWLAGGLIGWAWRRSERAMLALPAPLAGRWGGLAAALAYAVFCGWGVPAQRTVWMLALVTVLAALGVHWPWVLVLLSAAVLVTAIDPWALLQPGFWLSFAAVGLLMASGPAQAPSAAAAIVPGWRGAPARLFGAVKGGLRTQVIATLGLTPLGLLFFQQVSLVGLAANLVAIPLVTLLITPLALLGGIVAPLWSLGALVLQGLMRVLEALAAVPAAVWVVPVAPGWARLAGLLGAALLVLPLPWRLRLLAIPLALPLLMPPIERPSIGTFEVVAVDVGQGTAVLVRTQSHLLVYDAGPQYARESDAGQRVLLPLLRALGEPRIDTLLLSHRDNDHVGGARSLLTALSVGELLGSLEDGHPLLALSPNVRRCEAGQAWTWDGVSFELLQPPASAYATAARSNALSCVLRVASADASVLLTGDIERDQEARLVAADAPALRSDVLLVPHHGSKTSSTDAFLAAVAPKTAVFQAGYRNRFGHPAPEVVERYRARGIAVVASPSCGAWRWRSGDPPTGVCERDAARRYWHHRHTEGAE